MDSTATTVTSLSWASTSARSQTQNGSAPVANRGRQRAYNASTFYRWHASLFPRMGAGAMAGFEFASGIFSNSHIPEADARSLREVDVDRAD